MAFVAAVVVAAAAVVVVVVVVGERFVIDGSGDLHTASSGSCAHWLL